MSVEFLVHSVLWLLGFIFFLRVPVCKKIHLINGTRPTVSIIIPARNEEATIPILLRSLRNQVNANDEILVVDDHSEDRTAIVAEKEGARVIISKQMPPGWTGKTWACHQGALVATGTVLIFLDADTTVEDGGLDNIIGSYSESNGVLSIQPYHRMQRVYEQLSAFFNLILMAAMGSFTILGRKVKPIGLFGPVMVMEKKLYSESGAFEKVKGEILEDLAFGSEFKKRGVELYCYGGRQTVAFRMYPAGINQLITGWSKGFAMGAARTSIPVLIMIIAWITGAIATTRHLIQGAITMDTVLILFWGLLYIAFAAQIYWMLYRIGDFKPYTALLFPVPLSFFVGVFVYSFFIVFIRRSVSWKGRTIKVKRRDKNAGTSADSYDNNN